MKYTCTNYVFTDMNLPSSSDKYMCHVCVCVPTYFTSMCSACIRLRVVITIFDNPSHQSVCICVCVCTLLFMAVYDFIELYLAIYRDEGNLVTYTHGYLYIILYLLTCITIPVIAIVYIVMYTLYTFIYTFITIFQ